MNYTYTIRRLNPEHRFMSVVYSADGQPDIYKNFNPTDFSETALVSLIEEHAQYVVEQWEQMAAPPVTELGEGATGSSTQYPRRFADPPTYDSMTEQLEESWAVVGEVNQQSWAVVTLPIEEQIARAVEKAKQDRQAKEAEGLVWNDTAASKTYYLDTTPDSQARFAAARLAIESGDRVSGSVWKCAELVGGEPQLVFRATTNAELTQWAGLVHTHVQKCFDAEAATVAKIMAGDIQASFNTEFDLL